MTSRSKHGFDAFDLFCAYHLGLLADGEVRIRNIHQVARALGTGADEVRTALADFDMTPERVINCGFDVATAQADLAVAPDGVDRRELAKGIYQEYLEAKDTRRDWSKELEEDAARNADDPGFGGPRHH